MLEIVTAEIYVNFSTTVFTLVWKQVRVVGYVREYQCTYPHCIERTADTANTADTDGASTKPASTKHR
jgi:hypothetical protein